ncbi:OmpA family protein, partial [Pseudonocardia sp. EV170527-09]
ATGDLVTCQIFSANAAYVEILQKEVKQIFNNSIGCGADMQSMYHTEFIDQDAIPSVISALKGVPNVNLTWFGNQLSIQSQD